VGYVYISCSFDSDWNGLVKRLVFANGDISRSVLITGTEPVLIPHEVLIPGKMQVSAIGLSQNGEVKITTRKMILPVTVLEAGPQDGDDPEAYSPALWEQALSAMGDLTSLRTTAKTDLVSAINEIALSGGTGNSGIGGTVKAITSVSVKTRTPDGRLFGDANGDGVVNGSDVSAMLNTQVGLGFSRDFDPIVADLDGDGIVSVADMHKLNELVENLEEGQIIAKITINYDDYSSSVIYAAVDDIVDGKDGYTPVRGTDYWTDADKAEIKSYVDNAILGGAW